MKPRFNPFLILGTLSFITTQSWAVDRIKTNNADALNLSTSWVSGIPDAGDVAVASSINGAIPRTIVADVIVTGVASPESAQRCRADNRFFHRLP